MALETLIEKIGRLSPEKAAEVESFVDFLSHREEDARSSRAAHRLSEGVFAEIWDNAEDAVYDEA